MGIEPIDRIGRKAIDTQLTSPDVPASDRQLVAAVNRLNHSELLAQGRELAYRRDPKTGSVIIQLLERESGEVIDQIPPENIVQMLADLRKSQNSGDSLA